MGALDYLLDKMIDWELVKTTIKELSVDPKYPLSLAERDIDEAIRKLHPNPEDYAAFKETHKSELESLKEKLVSRYQDEIRERVSGLIG